MKRNLPVSLGFLILLGTWPLQAQDTLGIQKPGLILLKTNSASFQVTLRNDFFGPGSDPYVLLPIQLVGEELHTSPAGLFGTAAPGGSPPVDTVLELQHPYTAPPGTSEFRVVGLHLKSSQPVTITYNGGASSEQWDVEVCLASVQQLGGIIQLTRPAGANICGGTFSYSLAVTPRLLFRRRINPTTRVLDPGTTGFVSFFANGRWADRDQFSSGSLPGASLFEVGNLFQDAYIDANCDGVFDRDPAADCLTEKIPTLRSSDLVLGADCAYAAGGAPPHQWHLEPYTEGLMQTQVVQAATRASISYPESTTDRLGARRGRGEATELAGLALLGLAAVLIPSRRDREG